jgi:hypothetical protein
MYGGPRATGESVQSMNTARTPRGRPATLSSQPAAGSGGTEGNERLTAMTGAVLLILLLVECYTILRIGRLLTLHVFLGMLLLGPVALKAASVFYRFARYYSGSEPYRRKGPPAPPLRVMGPVIMLLTACVFGSGIMLAVTGPGNGPWLTLHRISFIAWAFFIAVHVLAHAWHLPRLLVAEARGVSTPGGETGAHEGTGQHAHHAAEVLAGRGTRLVLLIAALLGGLVIALLTVHLAGNWERPFG